MVNKECVYSTKIRSGEVNMYITVSMLIDSLGDIELSKVTIQRQDKISAIRIQEDNSKMQTGIMYLLPDQKKEQVLAQTTAGSSFWMRGSIFYILNTVLQAFDQYLKWQMKLSQAMERGCTLTELLNLSYPVIQHPMVILDANEWEIAHSDYFQTEEFDQDWTDVLSSHTSNAEKIAAYNQKYYKYFSLKKVYRIPGIFGAGYAFNILHNKSFYGLILMAEPEHLPKISQGEQDALQYLGDLICGMIGINSYDIDTHFPDKPLLEYLVNKDAESFGKLERSLEIVSWKKKDPKLVIYAEPLEHGSLAPMPSRSRLMFSRMDGIVTVEFKTGLVFLCNLRMLKAASQAKKRLSDYLRQISYYAGASSGFDSLSDIRQMLDQAFVSFENSLQISGYINDFAQAVVPYTISMLKKMDENILRHPCLDILKNYDRRYGSKLYETLFMYLKNERKVSKTVQDLDVPRSTLLNRLQRIDELLDVDLELPEVRLHILLSYLLGNEDEGSVK